MRESCRSTRYDAALLCVPDAAKIGLLDYLIEHGKHALVEKPLVAGGRGDVDAARSSTRAPKASCSMSPTITASSRISCACAI